MKIIFLWKFLISSNLKALLSGMVPKVLIRNASLNAENVDTLDRVKLSGYLYVYVPINSFGFIYREELFALPTVYLSAEFIAGGCYFQKCRWIYYVRLQYCYIISPKYDVCVLNVFYSGINLILLIFFCHFYVT